MGGIPRIYVRPVPDYPADKWRSTYSAHTRRNPPSKEPGVDYYCPLGTTLVSIGDGYVAEVGGNIRIAAGRYVKVNLDNGQSFRLLHLGPRHCLKRVGDRVRRGEPLAISGASGYGSEYFGASSPYDSQMILTTGGPHTHATLFPTHSYNNFVGLLDLEQWVMDSAPAGGTSSPLLKEWDEMATEAQIAALIPKRRSFIMQHAGSLYAVGPEFAGGVLYLTPEMHDVGTAGFWNLNDGEPLFADMPLFDTKGNGRAFEVVKMMYADPNVRVDVSEEDIAARVIAALSPEILAQQIVAHGVGDAVAEALAKRLAS